jgi:hypothetical protein
LDFKAWERFRRYVVLLPTDGHNKTIALDKETPVG